MSNVGIYLKQGSVCGICFPSDEQTKLIQDSLLDKLNKLKLQHLKEGKGEEETTEIMGFHRVLKIIFHKKYKNFKGSTTCKHLELKKQNLRYLREFAIKLNINLNMLDILSDKVSNNLAKYSFHMDVVSQQVKSFPRHFFNEKAGSSGRVEKEKQVGEKKSQDAQLSPEELPIVQEEKPPELQANIIVGSFMNQPVFLPNCYNYNTMSYPLQYNFPHINQSNQE